MTDLYVTDEMGRNVYYVYKMKMPSSGIIRTVKYDFGTKGYDIAFIAKDCLSVLGYKDINEVYQYVSPVNIINGNAEANVYMQIDEQHVEPVVLITLNGFFELVMRSDVPDAVKFRHWVFNEAVPALYEGENMAINNHHNGGIFESINSVYKEAGIPVTVSYSVAANQ